MTGRQHPAAGAFGMAQQPMGPPGDFPGFNPNPPPMHPMAFHQFQQQQARSIHRSPYDRVGVVNADP
jgi:hypothetical protein